LMDIYGRTRGLKCDECSSWLENTAGEHFSHCPNCLHRKLLMKLTDEEISEIDRAKFLESVPVAEPSQKRGVYLVNGMHMKAERRFPITAAMKWSPSPDTELLDQSDWVVARCDTFVKGFGLFKPCVVLQEVT